MKRGASAAWRRAAGQAARRWRAWLCASRLSHPGPRLSPRPPARSTSSPGAAACSRRRGQGAGRPPRRRHASLARQRRASPAPPRPSSPAAPICRPAAALRRHAGRPLALAAPYSRMPGGPITNHHCTCGRTDRPARCRFASSRALGRLGSPPPRRAALAGCSPWGWRSAPPPPSASAAGGARPGPGGRRQPRSLAIKAKFLGHGCRHAHQGRVEVHEGRVLLAGQVEHPAMRVEAVRLAWQVDGVREVIDEIQVAEPKTSATTWMTSGTPRSSSRASASTPRCARSTTTSTASAGRSI